MNSSGSSFLGKLRCQYGIMGKYQLILAAATWELIKSSPNPNWSFKSNVCH